jgi:hypothetical protein
MRPKERPTRYRDRHLPLAQVLLLKETGEWTNNPPRSVRERAAKMQGRGAEFTEQELDLAAFLMFALRRDPRAFSSADSI